MSMGIRGKSIGGLTPQSEQRTEECHTDVTRVIYEGSKS